jgi:hypothetical protein
LLGWTLITLVGSHLRSSRMAPCLSRGRLPSLAEASELRDVKVSLAEASRMTQGGIELRAIPENVKQTGAWSAVALARERIAFHFTAGVEPSEPCDGAGSNSGAQNAERSIRWLRDRDF